jgi:hypothetical protein
VLVKPVLSEVEGASRRNDLSKQFAADFKNQLPPYGRGAGVGRRLGVTLGLAVGVGVGVIVGVAVAVAVGVALGVAVGVEDAVGVAVGVGHGSLTQPKISTVSTRQPSLDPVVSLAIRQRSLLFRGRKIGRLTTVVTKPSDLPLHA